MQLRKIRAENAARPVSVLRSSDVISAFQSPYITLPKFRLPCDGLVASDHIEIASESRIHFATLLNC